ncbi:O-methyltransferase [Cesiribacter sp. SM1]|uniref:O-methyltransferase n=1 Tax=Cesiribacter sp. SM1 TaxID=2861196 RepID=UPI001CD5FF1A|nr:class I SAM-dependent methyltransferase [Cesiribacter sp. SM1]
MLQTQWQQKWFQARAWLQYWLHAVNEHSLQAPFVYQLYQQVVKPPVKRVPEIENLRQRLLASPERLEMHELGAGSSISRSNIRPVSSIARHSLTPVRFSSLLYRLVRHIKARNILELGTSLGINTLYLAIASPSGRIHTLEGCPNTAALAASHFQELNLRNISLHTGNIDEQLPLLLEQQLSSVDLAYLDANHTYSATLRYFEWILPHLHDDSVVVVDDIHWSADMQQAWLTLCQHPRVSLSIDLYEAGLLFFRPGLQRQHYVVEY